MGRLDECLLYLERVRDLADAYSRLNPSASLRSTMSTPKVPSTPGNMSSISFIGSFVSTESSSSIADIRDRKAWGAIEVIRSIFLQGLFSSRWIVLLDLS